MIAGRFELFITLLFIFCAYVCYNLLVAHQVRVIENLKSELTSLIATLLQGVSKDLSSLIRKEEDYLGSARYNSKSLSELLDDRAEEQDYQKFLDGIILIVKKLYRDYKFVQQHPAEGDTQSGYYLALQIFSHENPEEYDELFRLAVDKSLDPYKLSDMFVKKLAAGEVIALGDAVIDEANSGLSSILQGQDVRVNITYAPKEYMERKQEVLTKQLADYKEAEAEKAALAEEKLKVFKSVQLAERVLSELTDQVAEKYEMQELVKTIKESMGYA